MPFFSIVIPTFNRAQLLEGTIRSVQNQQFENWECIVVDDGSKDNTKTIVENIIKEDARIRYVYQENAERSVARNNGIKHALGEYICFLDSDDAFQPNHLSVLYVAIQSTKEKSHLYYVDMEIRTDDNVKSVSDPLKDEDIFHFLCYHPLIPARICAPSIVLKANVFDEDIVVVEDLILWLRLAEFFSFRHIPEPTVIYNLHGGNSVDLANTGFQKRLAGLKVFIKRYPSLWNKLLKKDKAFLIGNTHFGIARHHIYHKRKWKAIKELMLSIWFQKRHHQLKHKVYLILQLLKGRYEY